MPKIKQYKFGPFTRGVIALDYDFRQVIQQVSALGMVLGKEAPAIQRQLDLAYQILSTRSGFLTYVTLGNQEIKHFEDTLDHVISEIAMHNHQADVIDSIKDLKKKVVGYVKTYGFERLPMSQSVAPDPSGIDFHLPYITVEGRIYVALEDITAVFSTAVQKDKKK